MTNLIIFSRHGHPMDTDWRFITSDDTDERRALDVLDITNNEITRLAGEGSLVNFARWSPDSTQITVYSWRDDPNRDIFLLDALTGEETQLTDTPELQEAFAEWSPNGTQLLFHQTDFNFTTSTLNLLDLTTGEITLLATADGRALTQFQWFPDGETLTFIATRENIAQLYTIGTDGENETLITPEDQVVIDSPDFTRWYTNRADFLQYRHTQS